ncbi:hypothetical protein ACL9RF_01585 [Sphingobacterium sp. Mn56C]|uniref:hypothetical protein n=1 Tax=Sphingobacterium sp. Mn56C TaxID=3395261 RepID=UPI003BE96C1A
MKKIGLALSGLCLALSSCNKIDLDNVGYPTVERLLASEVKSALNSVPNGTWHAFYQDHEFFFRFNTAEGSVVVDSDFLADSKTVNSAFSTKGRAVRWALSDAGHFALLDPAYFEDNFIIEALPAAAELSNGITLKGERTGNTIVLLPTTAAYIDDKLETKKEFKELLAKNLLDNSVVTDAAGNFVAYYKLSLDYRTEDYNIKVITIENKTGNDALGHTQVYTSKLTKAGSVFTLTSPIQDIHAVSGKRYDFRSLNLNDAITITGMSDIKVHSNKNAVTLFDYTGNRKWSFNKAQNQGAASEEIWNATAGNVNIGAVQGLQLLGLDLMDPGMRAKERSMVFWTSGFRTRIWLGSTEGADIRKGQDGEQLFFTNVQPDGVHGNWGDAHSSIEINAIKQHFKALFDAWYSPEGLYVVKVPNAAGQMRILLLSPDMGLSSRGGHWIRCQ